MNVQFSLCAQSVSVDQLSSRISIFNVLEHIIAPSFPIFFPELTYVALIRGESTDEPQHRCTLTVLQGETTIAKSEAIFNFGNGNMARLIFNFSGLAINTPADIDFNLTLPNSEIHSLKIPVTQIPLPAEPGIYAKPAIEMAE